MYNKTLFLVLFILFSAISLGSEYPSIDISTPSTNTISTTNLLYPIVDISQSYSSTCSCNSTGGNTSWTQALAESLFYPLNSNPLSYYNTSSFNINDYYLKSNPLGFYNSSTLPAGGGNSSFNQSLTDELYYPLPSNPLGYYNSSTLPSSSAVPGGSNTYVQFNDNGVFNGSSNFTYNKINNTLTVQGKINVTNSQNSMYFENGVFVVRKVIT